MHGWIKQLFWHVLLIKQIFLHTVFFLNQTLTKVDTLQLDLSLNILVVVKEACHAEVEHV